MKMMTYKAQRGKLSVCSDFLLTDWKSTFAAQQQTVTLGSKWIFAPINMNETVKWRQMSA